MFDTFIFEIYKLHLEAQTKPLLDEHSLTELDHYAKEAHRVSGMTEEVERIRKSHEDLKAKVAEFAMEAVDKLKELHSEKESLESDIHFLEYFEEWSQKQAKKKASKAKRTKACKEL